MHFVHQNFRRSNLRLEQRTDIQKSGMCFWEEGGDHGSILDVFWSGHAFVQKSFCLDGNFEMGSEEDGRARSCPAKCCVTAYFPSI